MSHASPCSPLTFVLVQVTDGLLVGEDDGLVLCDDLPAEVLPAWGQLPQLLQLTHSATSQQPQVRLSGPAGALIISQLADDQSRRESSGRARPYESIQSDKKKSMQNVN